MPGQVKVWRDWETQHVFVQTDEGCFVFSEEFITEYFPPGFILTLQDLLDLTKKMVGQYYQPKPKFEVIDMAPVEYNLGFSITKEMLKEFETVWGVDLAAEHDGKYHVVEIDGILYPTRD